MSWRASSVSLVVTTVVAALAFVSPCPFPFPFLVASPSRPPVEPPAGAVPLASAPAQSVELTLPFDGIWGVIQGMNSADTHVGYAAFALDFVPAEKLKGALPEQDRHKLTDFPCYGRPVLAAADGKVIWAHDGAPDRPPGLARPARRVRSQKSPKHDPGNFLIIQHAVDEFTELRHLQSGSVQVKVGDRVRRGQAVAACGNSGNAGTPHLHVGLLGSADPIATRPLRFSRYLVLRGDGAWQKGDGTPSMGQLLRREPPPR